MQFNTNNSNNDDDDDNNKIIIKLSKESFVVHDKCFYRLAQIFEYHSNFLRKDAFKILLISKLFHFGLC